MTADEPTAAERIANAGLTANDYRYEPHYPNGKPVVHVDWTPEVRQAHAALRRWLADDSCYYPIDYAAIASVRQLLAEHDARQPRTIDDSYAEVEPPIGSVISRDRRHDGFVEVAVREMNGFWFFTNESSRYTLDDLLKFAGVYGPWTVIRWGLG